MADVVMLVTAVGPHVRSTVMAHFGDPGARGEAFLGPTLMIPAVG